MHPRSGGGEFSDLEKKHLALKHKVKEAVREHRCEDKKTTAKKSSDKKDARTELSGRSKRLTALSSFLPKKSLKLVQVEKGRKWGHPLKGWSREKTALRKQINIFCSLKNDVNFSDSHPSFRLFRMRYLVRSSHPSGSRLILFYNLIRAAPGH